ncbi:MAG: hypothetical protein ACLTSL_11910 [Odoribacter splanchnicus]
MESSNTYTDQSLYKLFQQLPEEKLPEHLNAGIMQEVYQLHQKKQQRIQWATWVAVSIACIGMIFFSIKVFQYLHIDFKALFQNLFTFQEISVSGNTLYFLIGGIALLLLLLDYRLRKTFLK